MGFQRLGHVAIAVQDIAKAVEFYQTMGLTLVWQDSDWAYLKAGDDGLALLGPSYKAAGPHFGFVFGDRQALQDEYDRLKAQGLKLGAIHDHRDGTASCYGSDPDHNLFELLYEPPAQKPEEITSEAAVLAS